MAVAVIWITDYLGSKQQSKQSKQQAIFEETLRRTAELWAQDEEESECDTSSGKAS